MVLEEEVGTCNAVNKTMLIKNLDLIMNTNRIRCELHLFLRSPRTSSCEAANMDARRNPAAKAKSSAIGIITTEDAALERLAQHLKEGTDLNSRPAAKNFPKLDLLFLKVSNDY